MMKIIRYDNYSKIYPDQATIFDKSQFNENISILYSVMSDEDLLDINRVKNRNSYTRGVI